MDHGFWPKFMKQDYGKSRKQRVATKPVGGTGRSAKDVRDDPVRDKTR